MSSIDEMFGTDETLEREGVWIDFGSAGRFLIASAGVGNPRFQRTAERVLKPYRKLIETNQLEANMARKLSAAIYAESVVIKWEGVSLRGVPLEYSRKAAEELLNDLPRLQEAIRKMAEDTATFQKDEAEAEAKN